VSERRSGDFVERISVMLIVGAFLGGFLVLLDIRLLLPVGEGYMVQIGKDGFSPELKGVVVQSMLITGFAAVVAFWLGTTKQGQEQAQSVSRIAEAAPTVAAAVVAAADKAPLKTEDVKMEVAGDVTVNQEKPK
jgi:hypothetical protein